MMHSRVVVAAADLEAEAASMEAVEFERKAGLA